MPANDGSFRFSCPHSDHSFANFGIIPGMWATVMLSGNMPINIAGVFF
jgi:hypothetical protein